jgi:hypothetical protein
VDITNRIFPDTNLKCEKGAVQQETLVDNKLTPPLSPGGQASASASFRKACEMKTLRHIAVWLIIMGATSCSPAPPAPGSGPHQVTGILLLTKEHKTLLKDTNPTTAKVGDVIPFRVVASWAIPYVDDVTDKTKFTVDPPERGKVDAAGLFTALAPGKIVIHAEVKVARHLDSDKVLGLDEPTKAGTATTRTNSVELAITEK